VTACSFKTSSERSTSLGRVRYQHCFGGRFRVLLNSDALTEGPPEALHANRIPAPRFPAPLVGAVTIPTVRPPT
jgi:hypothetical protein